MSVSGRELPTGTVTLLFTDVEGSTRLLHELGIERYAQELMTHRERVREAVLAHHGVEVGTDGDAFFVTFARAEDGLSAAAEIQAALAAGPIRVRMGLHTGEVLVADDDYVGLEVHKAARISAAAHGGQILVSQQTRELIGTQLRDLGEHRLKDLGAPERLFQLGDERFPPLRTLYRASLPVQPSPLVGRTEELAELVALARSNRLVTLTGTGGTGKTRLALALAAELSEHYLDGVWWVSLAAVSDHTLVLPTIGRAIGCGEDLAAYLSGRQLLLVLDNLEQILDAAPALAELLSGAPGLGMIATSRERLGLAAEQTYPVEPLSGADAIELFTTRARQVDPEFKPGLEVAAICDRLDRLPLALELAATRVKLLSGRQILARLEQRLPMLAGGRRDLPARQATMRAAIAWSYDLLSDNERRLFRRLAIFAGGFDLDAAEAVCGADLDELQSLADKSLLREQEEERYFLLETTREYAWERLDAAAETVELRGRHAAWFLELFASAEEGLRTAEQHEWLRRVRADNDNLRAVLAWALENSPAQGAELAAALFRPWRMSGQFDELIAWYEQALPRFAEIAPASRAAALVTFGDALMYTERNTRAEQVLTDALALFRSHADASGEASVLNSLGSVQSNAGSASRAIQLHEQALAIFRRAGDQRGISRSLHLLAENVRDVGELGRAASLLEQAVAIDTELGDTNGAMSSLHSLGDVALDQRDSAAAARHYRDALTICIELEDERSQAYCLAGLACVGALDGDLATAGRLWGLAERIEEQIGARMLARERSRYEDVLATLEGDEAFEDGRAAGRSADPRAV